MFDESKSKHVALWKLTRSEIEHENNLMNHRITWLLQSQGYLFAVFGIIFTAWVKSEVVEQEYLVPLILSLICSYAFYLCMCIQHSINRAQEQLIQLNHEFDEALDSLPLSDLPIPSLQNRGLDAPLGLGRTNSLAGATALIWFVLLCCTGFQLFSPFEEFLRQHGGKVSFGIFTFFATVFLAILISYKRGAKAQGRSGARPSRASKRQETS